MMAEAAEAHHHMGGRRHRGKVILETRAQTHLGVSPPQEIQLGLENFGELRAGEVRRIPNSTNPGE